METHEKVKLTSSEIAALWTIYQSVSMVDCFLSYFLEKAEDADVRSVVHDAWTRCKTNYAKLKNLITLESMPMPFGFSKEDVNLSAPRLYSDTFALIYLRNMAEASITTVSSQLIQVVRHDIREYFQGCLNDSVEIYKKTVDMQASKGVLIRAPFITMPEKSEMLKKESFMTGFLGRRRPLTAIEITHLHTNMERNAYGRTLITGFAQVVKNKKAREHLWRGKEIATKQMKVFSDLLIENELTAPMASDVNVTESTTAPFSDKLMMSMVAMLSAYSLNNYAAGASASMRRDLPTLYARLGSEVAAYAEEGAEITIEHGWLEQPPQADDRRELAGV